MTKINTDLPLVGRITAPITITSPPNQIQGVQTNITEGKAGKVKARVSFEAGASVGVPIPVMAAMIRAYSYDVDFQRDVQPGDEFQVMYERYFTDDVAVNYIACAVRRA